MENKTLTSDSEQSLISLKKLKRLEAKKRKLKAFLEICEINDSDKSRKRRKHEQREFDNSLDTSVNICKEPEIKDYPTDSFKCTSVAEYPLNSSSHVPFVNPETLRSESIKKASSEEFCDKRENFIEDNVSSESLQVLRTKMRERRNQKLQRPLFYLVGIGLNSKFTISHENNAVFISRPSETIFAQDIQHLLLVSIMGRETPYNTRWCRLIRYQKVSHVLLLLVDGISCDTFVQGKDAFSHCTKLFSDIVEVIPPCSYSLNFPFELSHVQLSFSTITRLLKTEENTNALINSGLAYKVLSSFFPIRNRECVNKDDNKNDSNEANQGEFDDGDENLKCNELVTKMVEQTSNFSRTCLLLSPVQMILESYPLPSDLFPGGKCEGYIFTKELYMEVTSHSPMFAVDCEMCLTTTGKLEVTRVSIVNENLEIIYDTLVKPEAKVVNYLTRYSGVTKALLDPVTTTLQDVQNTIQSLLPSDAILCGQSLNCDLHALKMIHPYVIDTSVIYNITGVRTKKTGLKILAQLFLDEEIQKNKNGHSPIEDSLSTMKLVLLKLRNGPMFGDVILGGSVPSDVNFQNPSLLETCTLPQRTENADSDILAQENKSSRLSAKKNKDSLKDTKAGKCRKEVLFSSLYSYLQSRNKSTCIIGSEDNLKLYPQEALINSIAMITANDNKMVVKRTNEEAINHFMTISHLDLTESSDSEKQLRKLDKAICKLYTTIADKALFIVIFNGSKSEQKVQNGMCMVKVKGN